MRLPYTSPTPRTSTSEEREILRRVSANRGSQGLIAVDRALFHAPLIADGYNAFFGAIRNRNSLPDDIREIAFLRVAALNRCWYEWEIHVPIAISAGLSETGLKTIKGEIAMAETDSSGLSEKQRAVLLYADAMTKNVRVSDTIFNRTKMHFSNTEMIELTASIAGSNMVTRFVVALDVGEKNAGMTQPPPPVDLLMLGVSDAMRR